MNERCFENHQEKMMKLLEMKKKRQISTFDSQE